MIPPATSSAAEFISGGPLTRVSVSPDLNCAVDHVGDSDSEFFGTTACATLIAVDNTLYGPAEIPAGGNAAPRTPWTPVDQEFSGAGTASNPYRIVTVVSGGGLRLTQTDTYVEGEEAYGTRVSIANETASAKDVTLYRAGDCYLQNSDFGYGSADATSGAVACTAGQEPGSRIEQWAPLTPGSHYYEAFYGEVWSWIGSRQPFPDSCECDTYQDNGSGLSWTTTIAAGAAASFSHLTAFSPTGQQVEDSDGDGFPDAWEEPGGGVDTNGDGSPDVPLSEYGATPDKPDVFVQVGWTRTRSCFLHFFCSTRNRRPSLAALRDVQQAFDEHGIRLHIDAGPDSLMDPDTGATWGSHSRAGDGIEAPSLIPGEHGSSFDWHEAFDGYRAALLPAERSRIFHFALYGGYFEEVEGRRPSGISRSSTDAGFGGRDLIFAYDAFEGAPTRIEEAGTFMHELGHNLGLSHGGALDEAYVNYKPNYPSLMNYDWQLSGVYKNSHLGLLDYSEGTLEPIDENSLSETAGLEPDSAALDIATKWRCPNGALTSPHPSAFNVDWNCDGQISDGTYGANINEANDPARTVMRDHDDWSALVFDGGGALGGAGDPVAVPAATTVAEPETPVLEEAAGDLQTVDLEGPAQLSIEANTSAPVQLTITNHHPEARTYQLTTTTGGVALSGLPSTVTVDPGETRTLTATLTAGVADPAAYVEVDGIAGTDLTDADSAITEVFVVDQTVADQPGLQPGSVPTGGPGGGQPASGGGSGVGQPASGGGPAGGGAGGGGPGATAQPPAGPKKGARRCKRHFRKSHKKKARGREKVRGRARCARARHRHKKHHKRHRRHRHHHPGRR